MLSSKFWNSKTSDIKLVCLYSTIKMMYGPINLRFTHTVTYLTHWYHGDKWLSSPAKFYPVITCKYWNCVFQNVKILNWSRVAGHPDGFNSRSVRIVFLTWCETSMVLLAAYSAFLISSLAVKPRDLPFRDLQGLLDDGSYRLGVLPNSSTLNMFDVWRTECQWLEFC